MIRDPSDGTVKEPAKPTLDVGTSGLRTDKLKADEIARLEKSRDWLKGYRNAINEMNRMTDKGEIKKDEA